jgi:uncharacterized protein YqgC (DUF456 family)
MKNNNKLSLGISLGSCVGVFIGLITHHLALGISIGALIGIAVGKFFFKKESNNN